jgi:hypothetical protein
MQVSRRAKNVPAVRNLVYRLDCLSIAADASFSFYGAVEQSPLLPIVPAPDDDGWLLVWSSRRNNWQGKPKNSEETCPSAALFTTNPTWPNPGPTPGLRGGKIAINRLSYGTSYKIIFRVTISTCLSFYSLSFISQNASFYNCNRFL